MSNPDYTAVESPQPRTQYPGMYPQSPQAFASQHYPGFASPQPSAPPASTSASPRAAATGPMGTLAMTGRGGTSSSWGPPGMSATATGSAPGLPSQLHHLGPSSLGRAASAWSPVGTSNGNGNSGGGGGGTFLTGAWSSAPGASGGAGGSAGAVASLREAFMAATAPQRPTPHVAPYSLHNTADEAPSWTSKYLRGNEGLRELVNTLLELAFVAPHRALNGGKSHLSISVVCSHGRESSLVGNKDDQMRSKLLELRVRGALGWSFELTLRPSSDVVLWDKYGNVAAAVQDNWFVLGAILKDQFGVVMEEDAGARPTCAACRRTCLAVTLNKIF